VSGANRVVLKQEFAEREGIEIKWKNVFLIEKGSISGPFPNSSPCRTRPTYGVTLSIEAFVVNRKFLYFGQRLTRQCSIKKGPRQEGTAKSNREEGLIP
jgi:hypothetical protein